MLGPLQQRELPERNHASTTLKVTARDRGGQQLPGSPLGRPGLPRRAEARARGADPIILRKIGLFFLNDFLDQLDKVRRRLFFLQLLRLFVGLAALAVFVQGHPFQRLIKHAPEGL